MCHLKVRYSSIRRGGNLVGNFQVFGREHWHIIGARLRGEIPIDLLMTFTKFLTLLSHFFLTLSQHSHFLLILSHKVIISLQFTHTFFLFP